MSRFSDGMSFRLFSLVVLLLATGPVCRCAEDRTRDQRLWERLRPHTVPPAEYAEDFGSYDSPLRSADGTTLPTPEQWQRRRAELLAMWHQRLGPWPPRVEKPDVKRLESTPQDGYVEHHVHVQISPEGKVADGYLLIPAGTGPFPAVLVPFYEPLTSIGRARHTCRPPRPWSWSWRSSSIG